MWPRGFSSTSKMDVLSAAVFVTLTLRILPLTVDVLLENLACKVTVAMALRILLDDEQLDPVTIDHISGLSSVESLAAR